jgi:predicted DNA binding CopG/RHH family protein
MPRPGPRRPYVALRLDAAALTWVDEQAAARGLNRSQMLRLMLSYAQEQMPEPAR